MTLDISINSNTFVLHCSGAAYWAERRLLIISDAHLGKISHFRKFGSAIPGGAIHKNFSKLNEAVAYFEPEGICFLGDLFHSSLNNEWNLFKNWTEETALPIMLIAGNHDIISPQKYHDININIVSEYTAGGFLFTHYPEQREGYFNFCGHIHPAIVLAGAGRQFLKLPCFFRSAAQLIFPAFGEFTGTYVMEPAEGDRVYAIAKDDVVAIEPAVRVVK